MNLLDRVIAAISPTAGINRMVRRAQLQALAAAYDAADRTRTNRDWRTTNYSSDGALESEYSAILARSRAMVRNDDAAKSGQRAYRRHVVGTGITAIADAIDPYTEQPLADFNRIVNLHWRRWSNNKKLCDAERKKTILGKQRVWINELYAAGQIFLRKCYVRRPNAVGLVIQELESEQLDTNISQFEGRSVRGGIETDDAGAPVAYHFHTTAHPLEEYPTASVRIPADQIIHLCDFERVRQSIGEPWMAPSLRRNRNLSMYDSYMMVGARLQAAFAGVVVDAKNDPSTWSTSEAIARQLSPKAAVGESSGDSVKSLEINIEPGMFPYLPGKDIKFPVPSNPNSQYAAFTQEQLKRFAAGTGLDYAQVARWYADGSFSAQLQALLDVWRETDPIQLLIIDAMQEIRTEFIVIGIMEDRFSAPGFFDDPLREDGYCRTNWKGPAKKWINPADQAAAWKILLDLKLASPEDYFNEQGVDGRAVYRSISQYRDLAQELEIDDSPDAIKMDPREPRPTKKRPIEQEKDWENE